MINDILEQKLIADGFVSGVTLFRDFIPADVGIAVMTKMPLRGLPKDPHIPGRFVGEIQVIVRHTDPVLGEQMAFRIDKVLSTESRQVFSATATRGETHIDLFYAETLPIKYPRLDSSALEWSQNFKAVFGVKPLA